MPIRLLIIQLLIGFFGLLNPLKTLAQTKYEAEAGSPQVLLTQSNIGNSNGVSYAENLTKVGATVTFTVSVPTAGMYTVTSRYAAARGSRETMSVYVNNADVTQAQFPTSFSWSYWNTQSVTVALQAGTNTIGYKYNADDSGWINLDYILISLAGQPKYEAEAGSPQVLLTQSNIGNSNGVSYAENLTKVGSSVTFTVLVPTTGMYTVTSRYAAASDYMRTMSVYVNNVDVAQAQFPTTASWASWNTQTTVVALLAGTNTITYRYDADDNGWINLDYIQVDPASSLGFTAGSLVADNAFPQEVGIDKFTGTASVTIPLHTVTIPGVTLPIALVYAATGLQVAGQDRDVAANWSLQANPSINRLIRDLPDDIKQESTTENRYGWLRYPTTVAKPDAQIRAVLEAPATINSAGCSPNELTAFTQLDQFGSLQQPAASSFTLYDTQPDIYFYSVPGHSGRFVFDGQGRVRTIPYDPITITPVFTTTGELGGFTIKAPDGVITSFNQLVQVTQKATPIATTPKYLVRDYTAFRIQQNNSSSLRYTASWLASSITTPTAGSIQFDYQTFSIAAGTGKEQHQFLQGNSPNRAAAEYTMQTEVVNMPWLSSIKSATSTVTFDRGLVLGDVANPYPIAHINGIRITSPLNGNALLKTYLLQYGNFSSSSTGQKWFTPDGALITSSSSRTFLNSIVLSRGTTRRPIYTFAYHNAAALTPRGAVNQDFWGFANANGATTATPKIFIEPQLLGSSPTRPAAPYRLYQAASTLRAGEIVLSGADRRPAVDFNVALAGTLAQITFVGGGKALFEYEQHQFYDPVAQQSLPAGGLRIRTIKVQDPVTKVETRRDYTYQEDQGPSSGVLLHIPRFAFTVPTASTASSQQWADATVRCGDDLAPDYLEPRHIGYHQVTEWISGKGQVVTVFHVPGSADEITVSGNPASEPIGWQRPLLSIARKSSSAGTCASVAPLQTGTELYPFPTTPNYDFRRGLPQTILFKAELLTTTSPRMLVRQQDFVYQYTNLRPDLLATPVTGLVYEPLTDPANQSAGLYAYAKYTLLTDYQYTIRQETTLIPSATGAPLQSVAEYRYNSKGWLATKAVRNSDKSYLRTRYKYLSDYAVPASTTEPLKSMYTRLNTEQLSTDIVETISEVISPTGERRYRGATLQTFTSDRPATGSATLTRPFQLLSWQPSQPVVSYDSTYIDATNASLHLSPELKPASTILEVDAALTALSTRIETGRQIQGRHLGYAGRLPLLQIANATAAEVLFSDFEDSGKTYYLFEARNSGGALINPTATAARTGKLGVELTAGGYLSSSLPVSVATRYRLTFWAQASQATTLNLTLSNQSVIPAQPIAIDGPVNGQAKWRLYEVILSPITIPASTRSSSQLKLTVAAGSTTLVQFDDVTLLPADASTTSTTYDVALGKSSETDARGRTTYYEYNGAGDLSLIRDHNGAIRRQLQQVIPGETPGLTASFSVEGSRVENNPLTFTAYSNFGLGTQYSWDFGDGVTPVYSTSPVTTHTFISNGLNKDFPVILRVLNQGKTYVIPQNVGVSGRQLVLTSCAAGVIAIDDCGVKGRTVDLSCNASATTGNATYSVTTNLSGGVTYSWERAYVLEGYPLQWAATGNTSNSMTISYKNMEVYRCRVSNASQEAISDNFSIYHYQSTWNPDNPCVPAQ